MIIFGGCLSVIPALIACFFLAQTATLTGKNALETNVEQSLIAIRDITAAKMTQYVYKIEKQAKNLSYNLTTVEAMKNFQQSFTTYPSEVKDSYTDQNSLDHYYHQIFDKKYQLINNGTSANVPQLMSGLDQQSLALQYAYISNNPQPVGSKHLLNKAGETTYDQFHAKYHPTFKQFIESFGYYDLFLVDAVTGDIVYSVFKELDYTTSLIDGPYAQSGIGQAFMLANASADKHFTGLTDFSPYVPSYNAPASFIASPIFDGDQKVGILILQMPVDELNNIMTHDGKWKQSGLGDSGETYLVGQDFTMRSNGRFLIEDKPNYLALMQTIGVPEKTIASMDQKETSIGLQPVITEGTEKALQGESGFSIFPDYRGISVLSAYKPLNVGGLTWAIMSEIDEAEAFAPVQSLSQSIQKTTLYILSLALITGPLLGWLLAQTVVTPIKKLVDTIHNMADGEGDLTQRVENNGKTELDELAQWLNHFIEHLDSTFSQLIKSAVRLVPMSEELSEGNNAISDITEQQNEQIKTVEERLESARQSSLKVNEATDSICGYSQKGVSVVNQGLEIFNQTNQQMSDLETVITKTAESTDQLKEESNRIVSVIDVINAIADQTNLLALNAAIEAARAGDAGRGFAVVADEVRALALRTSEATLEVSSMVEAIQSGTDIVVDAMAKGSQSTRECNIQVDHAKQMLSNIDNAIGNISDSANTILSTFQEQNTHFSQVSDDFKLLDQQFDQSKQASLIAAQVGEDMSTMSMKLHKMVDHFKLSDNNWSTKRRDNVRLEEQKSKQ